jgi:hypothetical protein
MMYSCAVDAYASVLRVYIMLFSEAEQGLWFFALIRS